MNDVLIDSGSNLADTGQVQCTTVVVQADIFNQIAPNVPDYEGQYAKHNIPFLYFLKYMTGIDIDRIQLEILAR
jgi:hypothetical protein